MRERETCVLQLKLQTANTAGCPAAHGILACMIVLGLAGQAGKPLLCEIRHLRKSRSHPWAPQLPLRKGVFTPYPLEAMSSRPLFRIPISFDEARKAWLPTAL